jgi:hypothetical protein
VIEPHALDSEELRGNVGKAFLEDELPRNVVGAPQIRDLQKRLVIRIAFFDRRNIGISANDFGGDVLAIVREFIGRKNAFELREAVAFVR